MQIDVVHDIRLFLHLMLMKIFTALFFLPPAAEHPCLVYICVLFFLHSPTGSE